MRRAATGRRTHASTLRVTGTPRRSAIIPLFYEARTANDHGSGTSQRDRKLPARPAQPRGRASGVSLTTTPRLRV
ncbi:LigA protein [Burkholderia sp. KJ006]|nr:LigA protein [Burkholderia sp. KJ006]